MTYAEFDKLMKKIESVEDNIKTLQKERDFYKRKYEEALRLIDDTLQRMETIHNLD